MAIWLYGCMAIWLYGCMELRGWRNTVEMVLLEIPNSMKPYASVFRAHTSKLGPGKCFFEPNHLDEFSNRILPTSQEQPGSRLWSIRKLRIRRQRMAESRFLGSFLWTWEVPYGLGNRNSTPLNMKNPLESNPPKSRFSVCGLTVVGHSQKGSSSPTHLWISEGSDSSGFLLSRAGTPRPIPY